MQERMIRRNRNKDHENVLEDKINGKSSLEVVNEFKHLENRVKNYDASLVRNSSNVKSLLMTFAETDKSEEKRNNRLLDGGKAEKIEKSISKSLQKTVGRSKSKDLAKKFIFQAKEYGIEKAADNLVKDVTRSTKRHSGRKIGAFARKSGSLSKVSKRSTMRKVSREEKVEARIEDKKKQAIKIGGKEGAKLASIIDKQMIKSKTGRVGVSKKIEKLKEKEPIEKRIEKAFEKQVKLTGVREAALRKLRRTARKLKNASRNIQEISNANNGIHLSARGENAAKGLQAMINNVLQYANEGAAMRNVSVSSTRTSSQTMMIDALLQKGRASMMAASRRTNVMRKSLIKEQQLDQARVRS